MTLDGVFNPQIERMVGIRSACRAAREEIPLKVRAVRAEHIAVIGREDHHRVLREALIVEELEDASEFEIER